MKTALVIAMLLIVTTSAFAQARVVLTNADLGHRVPQQITMTPAQWENFVAHQFVYIPPARFEGYGGRVPQTVATPAVNQTLERPSFETPWMMWSYSGRNPYIPVYGVSVGGVTVSAPIAPFVGPFFGSLERPRGIHRQPRESGPTPSVLPPPTPIAAPPVRRGMTPTASKGLKRP